MLKLLLVIDRSRVRYVNCEFPDNFARYKEWQSINEPDFSRIFSQDSLLNAVLSNAVEFLVVVYNVVVLRAGNAFISLQKRDRIQ
jgi:hypothetical protein